MAWNVGNGEKVRIGSDAIIGCNDPFLPLDTLAILRQRGYYSLNRVVNPNATSIWSQGWL